MRRAQYAQNKDKVNAQKRAAYAARKLLEKADRDILAPSHDGNGENPDVNFVCRLNRELYKVITDDIKTDEVIITDERIQHIRENHPNDYEQFNSYLPKIIQEPDYIIRDTRPQTGIILKEIGSVEQTSISALRSD